MKTTTTTTKKIQEFDIMPGAVSLLLQLEARLGIDEMKRAAKAAASNLLRIEEMTAAQQQAVSADYSLGVLQAVDLSDSASAEVAVTAAALLTAAKAGPATATERVRAALADLSERYEADW